jgi:hypothetical protein
MVDKGLIFGQNFRFTQVESEFIRYKLKILGLSEIKGHGTGEYKSPTGEAWYFIVVRKMAAAGSA